MDTGKLLEGLFDAKIVGVLKFFLMHKERDFYLQEIANATNVPLATLHRMLKKLVNLGIIQQLKIKNLKLYRCVENETTIFLEGFIKEGRRILDEFIEKATQIANVEEIILHGRQSEDKANILIIGSGVNGQEIKQLCNKIKEERGFTLTTLILERAQYEQMAAMGLYSGSKETLFRIS